MRNTIKLLIISSLFVVVFLLLPTTNYQLLTASAATLSLSPSAGTFNKNCVFSLNILLNTANSQTDGTDAYLIYDASRFTATSILNGTTYSEYAGNSIDTTLGRVWVSGLTSDQPFTGQGTFATVNFSVKATAPAGSSQIRFDFDPNDKTKTSDSNVIEHNNEAVIDVLSSVTDGSYTIGTGTACAATNPSSSPYLGQGAIGATSSASPSPSPEVLPPAGSAQLTVTLAIMGITLTILGILGLALL